MALERVAELVRRASRDAGVLHALRNDPARLRSALGLSSAELDALHGATAFTVPVPFTKAKAVAAAAATQTTPAVRNLGLAPAPLAGVLDGSLLPPEGSGQFTGATGGFGFTPRGDPGVKPPPPAPGVTPPSPGIVPPLPPSPPRVGPLHPPPVTPLSPLVPPAPRQPAAPQPCPPQVSYYYPPPRLSAHPTPVGCACQCCAVVGIVSAVSTTAMTAITAITAIAGGNRQH